MALAIETIALLGNFAREGCQFLDPALEPVGGVYLLLPQRRFDSRGLFRQVVLEFSDTRIAIGKRIGQVGQFVLQTTDGVLVFL